MKTHHTASESPKLYRSKPVYFQTGLVISLLIVYLALETALPVLAYKPPVTLSLKEDDITYITEMPPVKKEAPKKENKTKKSAAVLIPSIIDDPVPTAPDKEFLNEPGPELNLTLANIKYIEPDPPSADINIEAVEFVPVFPGCETLDNNEARRACMSEKIG